MSENKHTPGPWAVGPRNRVQAGCLVLIGEGEISARPMNDHYATKTEQNFNARLIASAPDLLAACESALDYLSPEHNDGHTLEWTQSMIASVRCAIAKAKGTP